MAPRKLPLNIFVFRISSAIAGSLIGTLILSVTFFSLLSAFAENDSHTFSLYIVLALVLIGTLAINVITPSIISFVDREKYPKPTTIMTHTFTINIILFVISIPLYIVIGSIEAPFLNYMAGFHFLVSAQIANIIMEIFSENRFILAGVYAVAIGSLVCFGLLSLLYLFGNETFFIFVIGPVLWIGMELIRSLIEITYYGYYRLFGIEALDTDTSYESQEK